MLELSEAPQKNIVVQGVMLKAGLPYDEGHELSEKEAGVLNQTRIENLRNNFASKVKKYREENKIEDGVECTTDQAAQLQADFAKMEEGYDFGVGSGRQEADPVRRQALALATTEVKKALKKKGHKLSEVGDDRIKAYAEKAVDDKPAFMKKAQEIVDTRNAAADELSLDLE